MELGVYEVSLRLGVLRRFTLKQQLVGCICHLFYADTLNPFSDSKGTHD